MHKLFGSWLLLILSVSANGQLTIKDFTLCLDNSHCATPTLRITKEDFLKSKKLIPNFSWFTIESAIAYIGEGNYTSEITTIALPKDEFTKESKKIFERLTPGDLITIVVKGHNKQHIAMEWSTLSIIIQPASK